MQTLQQQLGSSQPVTSATHPVLRELMADPVTAYAEEVRILRQRVALLEAELAATKAAQAAEAQATPVTTPVTTFDDAAVTNPSIAQSEFTECVTPAVFAIDLSQPAAAPSQTQGEATQDGETEPVAETAEVEPVPNPGFAQAWIAEEADASFEERVAERAFFQTTTVDEESRTWLLAE